MDEAEQNAERRRLAGAVRSEETGDAAAGHDKGQAVDGRRLPVPLVEVDDLNHAAILDRLPKWFDCVGRSVADGRPGRARTALITASRAMP
jgi:hypothetical protein